MSNAREADNKESVMRLPVVRLFPELFAKHLPKARIANLDAFSTIVSAGEPMRDLLMPIDGGVRVLASTGLLGEEALVDFMSAGSLIALPQVITGEAFPYTIATDGPCRLLMIPRDGFVQNLSSNPQALQALNLLNSSQALLNFVSMLMSEGVEISSIVQILNSIDPKPTRFDRQSRFSFPGSSFAFIQDGRAEVVFKSREESAFLPSLGAGQWAGGSHLKSGSESLPWTLHVMQSLYVHFLDHATFRKHVDESKLARFAHEAWETATDGVDEQTSSNIKSGRTMVRKLGVENLHRFGFGGKGDKLVLDPDPNEAASISMKNLITLLGVESASDPSKGSVHGQLPSLGACAELLERQGLITRAYYCDPSELDRQLMPCLIYFKGQLAVGIRATKTEVTLFHPRLGLIAVDLNTFASHWDGTALEVRVSEIEESIAESRKKGLMKDPSAANEAVWERLFSVEKPYIRTLTALAIFAATFQAAMPLLFEKLVDNVIAKKDFRSFTTYIAGLLLLVGFIAVARALNSYLTELQSSRLSLKARSLFLRQMYQAPVANYGESQSFDAFNRLKLMDEMLRSRCSLDINFGSAFVMGAIYLAVLVRFSWGIALIALFGFVGVVFIRQHFASRGLQSVKGMMALKRNLRIALSEQIGTQSEIKSFSKESNFAERTESSYFDYVKGQSEMARVQNMAKFLADVCVAVVTVVCLAVLIWESFKGFVSPGAFLAIVMLLQRFWGPALTLGDSYGRQAFIRSEYDSMASYLRETEYSAVTSDKARAVALRGKIHFENVNYRYREHGPLTVSELSFTIQPGQIVAIVGQSGAGKSTVGRLIAGLIRPEVGRIYYDDIDSRTLSGFTLRDQIGYLSQRSNLVSGSVIDNIALGEDRPDFARVEKAARLSGAISFIEKLPGKWGQLIGQGGSSLSSGEQTQICLARALYRNPRVLVLDEVGASLDPKLVQTISENLVYSSEMKTLVIITQRLSSIKRVDKVMVLKNGTLFEDGTHNQLMKNHREYSELYRVQVSSY